ncbi:uncharacterized protein LOC5573655 [Aedes aegypti]|uniref:Uncharacterized protein n=1 Tax=Aedes aegypti TaxID=7159 RepID=A0A6I8TJE6_AEDAE|nr:uncharacterized protein LOC5573655 [Aedes aegypti]
MKFIVVSLFLTLYCTFSNCKSATKDFRDINDTSNHLSLDEILKYVEDLVKQLEESMKTLIDDIEKCFPLDGQKRREMPFVDPRSSHYSSSESSLPESNLWDILEELMMETLETVRDIIKRILGIQGATRLLHVMNMNDGFDQQIIEEKVEQFAVYAIGLLKNRVELDTDIADRLEDLLLRVN